VGQPAPDFALVTLDGAPVRLADFRGRPLVLNFFASWCDPCKEEAPVVKAMAEAGAAQGYSVLGIAIQDERGAAAQFMAEGGLTFPAALDLDSKAQRAYRVIGPPTTFFVDGQGVLRHIFMGPLTPADVAEGLRRAGSGAPGTGSAGGPGTGSPSGPGTGSASGPGTGSAGSSGTGPAGLPGLALAAGMGLLSFLSPCILPLLPAYMGYITGLSAGELERTGSRRRRPVGQVLAFAAGLVLVFVLLGASVSAAGAHLTPYRPVLARLSGLVVVAFGLHMTGLLHLPFLQREFRPGLALAGGGTGDQGGPSRTGGGTWRSAAMGVAFGLGWTPCVGPMLGTILVLAGQEQTVGRGMLLLLAYGLGMGVPFVLAGVALDRVLGSLSAVRRHLGLVTAVSGALLVAMGLLLAADQLAAIGLWLNRVL
jgi:cytochrome c-type biogenesis protein